ncbi:MAG: hypothetical protein WBE55_09315 [Candidatus Sulfotelmatobacter sp.]
MQELEKTRLAVGTWVRFDYRNDLTKKQIREFFIACLGIELDEDRISLRSSSFVVSFDRMQIASLIQWLISEWSPNKNHIKVSLPREGLQCGQYERTMMVGETSSREINGSQRGTKSFTG